jgi:lipoprotein-anchoring transpeptidase ErfK/SrfK
MPPSNPPRPPGSGDPRDPRRRLPGPAGRPPGAGRPGRLEGPGGLEGPPQGSRPARDAQPPRGRPAPRPGSKPPDDDRPVRSTAEAGGDLPAAAAADTPRPKREPAGKRATDTGEGAGRGARRAAAKRRSKRRAFALGAVIVLIAGGVAAFALSSGGGEEKARALNAHRVARTTTTTAAPVFEAFTTVTTMVPELVAYSEPSETAEVVSKFSDKTEYGLPRTLLSIGTQEGWYQTLLPMRPNGSTGWVKASEVTPGSTTFEMKISLSQHKLWLTDSDNPVLEAAVVIGKPETPTPLGTYYVTDPVDLQSRPNGAYGAYALGLSGYSEVLKTFNGGPGQIAVHGGAYESNLGTDVSNGCVRVLNDVILQIAKTVPLGTPVVIEA